MNVPKKKESSKNPNCTHFSVFFNMENKEKNIFFVLIYLLACTHQWKLPTIIMNQISNYLMNWPPKKYIYISYTKTCILAFLP
jgi:hypothetical protein